MARNATDATDAAEDALTATEFIPADENGLREEGPGVRYLQATGDTGMEIVNEEPHDDDVRNHVFVCDQCGQSEDRASDMGQHLHYDHAISE